MSEDGEKLLTMPEVAAALGRSERQVRRLAEQGGFPTWQDPVLKRLVTTMEAINRSKDAAARKALEEFEQRDRLAKGRNRR